MSGISRAALIVAIVSVAARAAWAEERPLPRIAIGQIGEFHVAKSLGELGPDVVIRGAAQGARDACLGPDGKPRPPTTCDRPAPNAPTGVCVDTTLYKALAPLAECEPTDHAPEALELHSPCRTTECITADAKAAGATHLLVVQGKSTEFGLDVALDLITLATGAQRSKRYRDYFPASGRSDAEIMPRTGPQIVAIVHGMARDAVGEMLTAPLEPPAAVPPPVGGVTAPVVPDAPAGPRRLPKWVGWAVAGAGVAAVAVGAYYWHVDGAAAGGCKPNPDLNDACLKERDTKQVGIPVVIGGLVAVGAGGWLIYRSSRSEVTATVSLGGVGIRGSF